MLGMSFFLHEVQTLLLKFTVVFVVFLIRAHAVQVVKNLSGLLKVVNLGQLGALEELIKDWVKNGSIDKACIQVHLLLLCLIMLTVMTDLYSSLYGALYFASPCFILVETVRHVRVETIFVQVMWERFSQNIPDTSEDDSLAALVLLGMVAG